MTTYSNKLRLGPLPKSETAKLTFVCSAKLKNDLDVYAALHSQVHGETVEAAALIPHILEAFMARDRGFKAARHGGFFIVTQVEALGRAGVIASELNSTPSRSLLKSQARKLLRHESPVNREAQLLGQLARFTHLAGAVRHGQHTARDAA